MNLNESQKAIISKLGESESSWVKRYERLLEEGIIVNLSLDDYLSKSLKLKKLSKNMSGKEE